jgi:hypothetical protein
MPRGRQEAAVDSGLLAEEESVGDGALPSDVASGSSSKVLLHLQRKTVRFIGLDGDGGGWWWCLMVSQAAGGGAQSRGS